MKLIRFLGNSLECLREFLDDARQDAGYQLDQLQRGKQPSDFKPMTSVGKGVEELEAQQHLRERLGRSGRHARAGREPAGEGGLDASRRHLGGA